MGQLYHRYPPPVRRTRSDPGLFSDDDFHPDGEGHGVWAEAVLDSLEV